MFRDSADGDDSSRAVPFLWPDSVGGQAIEARSSASRTPCSSARVSRSGRRHGVEFSDPASEIFGKGQLKEASPKKVILIVHSAFFVERLEELFRASMPICSAYHLSSSNKRRHSSEFSSVARFVLSLIRATQPEKIVTLDRFVQIHRHPRPGALRNHAKYVI